MAFEKTLLERIDDPDTTGERRLHADPHRVSQSVIRHLQKMLNVRQGSVLTLPDYGMPDFNDLAKQFPSAIVAIRRVIKDSLEKYEPRLRRVQIRHIPNEDDPMDLQFEISARLVLDDEESAVTFQTVLNDTGHVQARS